MIHPAQETLDFEVDLLDGWAEGSYEWPHEHGPPPSEITAVCGSRGTAILEPGDEVEAGETVIVYRHDGTPTFCGSEGCSIVFVYRCGEGMPPARSLPEDWRGDVGTEPAPVVPLADRRGDPA